jgi:hypothetical protein
MPGAVPLEDLPNELRGTAVPLEDLPNELRGTAVPLDDLPGAAPPRPNRAMMDQDSMAQLDSAKAAQRKVADDAMARWQGEVAARTGVLDMATNALVNTPTDMVNAGANFLASAVGRTGKILGIDNSIEENARTHGFPRIPLLTNEGQQLGQKIGEAMPDWVRNMDPLVGDSAALLGGAAGARTSGLLPKGPVLNEFSGNVARLRGKSPYQNAPAADVAQRYTVVPDDVRHSAGMGPQEGVRGSTRSSLGPQVAESEIPVANIRTATQRATQDLPGQLLDPNGRVDAGRLANAIEAEAVPYQQIAQLPPPAANTLAERIRTAWQERGGSLKGDAVAESRLLPLMDAQAPALPTDELLRRWREINSYASDLRKASGEGSPAAQIKSGDLRSIADAVLDEIEHRASVFANPQLVEQLKTARVNIARLHALDDSLDSVGWVDPAKLVSMAERHVPLSGGLAEVAADAAAAPRSLRAMGPSINAADSQLDRFGREPHSWVRNVVGRMGGNLLARRGIDSLNQELRAGSGLLRAAPEKPAVPPLYGPNEGPQAPPPPMRLLPAPEPPGPMQGGGPGGPAPALPGVYEDLGYTPDVRAAGAAHPGAAVERAALTDSTVPTQPRTRQQLLGENPASATDAEISTLIGELDGVSPRNPPYLADALADFEMGNMEAPMPDRPRGVTGPLSGSLRGKKPPEGFRVASGPMDQPQVSEAARRIAEMRQPKPRFGPDDEFPDAAAPVEPQGPGPSGGGEGGVVGEQVMFDMQMLRDAGLDPRVALTDPAAAAETVADMLRGPIRTTPLDSPDNPYYVSPTEKARRRTEWGAGSAPAELSTADDLGPASPPQTVYRGVPIGADPRQPVNSAGATHWTPDPAEAPTYGPNVGEAVPVNPADLGTIVDLLSSVGLDPATAGQPGVLMEALRRYRAQPGAAEWARFSYPIEGNPTEYVHFPPQGK